MRSTIVGTCVRVKQLVDRECRRATARFDWYDPRFSTRTLRRARAVVARRYRMPNRTRTLPLIPLDDAVVLPNMALAVALATDEARAAVDDALSSDGPAQVVLVPRRDGRFARI